MIAGDGGTARASGADISESEDRRRLVADVLAAFGPVDILVDDASACLSWLNSTYGRVPSPEGHSSATHWRRRRGFRRR
jgi:NAD(P)-dependent dehydrogenase (short-subunit alcohol dehydrogenase family)